VKGKLRRTHDDNLAARAAGSEKLLLETVPGKIQGRRRAHSFADQGVDGISRSKGLRSRQRISEVNALMGQVLKFRCNDVFFPGVMVSMGEAYDAAIATLPPDAQSVFYFRERKARRIMKAAYAGEIDPYSKTFCMDVPPAMISTRGALHYWLGGPHADDRLPMVS
jgi:hypothetical protein